MRATFHQWRQQGQVQRWRCGWKIAPPPAS
jgi:hypothetical protein